MAPLLLLALALLFPLTQATTIKYCDNSGDYVVKVNDVRISPNPVIAGKPASFDISASAGRALSGGKVVIHVIYFGIQVHTETHDICDEVSCPISMGDFVLSHTETLPVFTPPGTYTLRITMVDANKEQLTCISFNFKIGFGLQLGSLLFAS
ncbi:putative phosphatidylglycerol/phosphatidylinositol transfer protein DDB_G0282179 [Punica granatum]|uniref:Phosphatidylglycerol/phosphatidylinositol transfer protein DDB_G0282179 n=1 Tax=Punica granatum TaxID=22663 RepID=A0A6P8E6J2_PUNGR|nr:putative phosphatidylglycerol/phosphatidylinositol transfer protein DDB_G0282179 [Punica granatum]